MDTLYQASQSTDHMTNEHTAAAMSTGVLRELGDGIIPCDANASTAATRSVVLQSVASVT